MKFTVTKSALQAELGLSQGVVEAKATIPILSHLLLQADKEGLQLLATDLEIGLRTRCQADVTNPGAVAIPAKKLHDVVRSLSSDVVAFEKESNNWVRVESGSFRGRIVGLPAEDFPPQPEFPAAEGDVKVARVPLGTFQQMITRVLFAVTTENTRFSINGALMKLGNDSLTLVATDGHRLAHASRSVDLPGLDGEIQVLVPRKALAELSRLRPEDEEEELAIAAEGNHVFFEAMGRTIYSRTLEGSFPSYDKVIPSDNTNIGRVDRAGLAEVLSRVAVLTSDTSKLVALGAADGTLSLSTNNPNMGEAREELPIEWSGEETKIGLNYEYVLQFLQTLSCEKVELRLKDSRAQALFVPAGDEPGTYEYVVMPMRLG